jgi:DNA-binding response OmpR family regulator
VLRVGSPGLLIIEDDDAIGSSLERALAGEGYDAHHVATAMAALEAAARRRPDLVLLDLGLPDMDGVALCRQLLARHPQVPVIMLTARRDEIDVVLGLDAGAVDYIGKPFRLAELLARVRAQLRRPAPSGTDVVEVGDLRVDTAARRVWLAGRELDLRAKEFDLLAALALSAGRAVTRDELMLDVWDMHWAGSTKTLDVHIAALRRHLDPPDAPTSRITTLRGVGYRLEPQ